MRAAQKEMTSHVYFYNGIRKTLFLCQDLSKCNEFQTSKAKCDPTADFVERKCACAFRTGCPQNSKRSIFRYEVGKQKYPSVSRKTMKWNELPK